MIQRWNFRHTASRVWLGRKCPIGLSQSAVGRNLVSRSHLSVGAQPEIGSYIHLVLSMAHTMISVP